MKIAALYDKHGNLPALNAVLHEVDKLDVDLIVVGGDVLLGPMPTQCLDRLAEIEKPVKYVMGNCDELVIDYLKGKKLPNLPQTVIDDIKWTAKQIENSYYVAVSNWPMTQDVESDTLGKILFCHSTPTNHSFNITRLTPEDKLKDEFGEVVASIIVCGHTHMQFDRMIADKRAINAGSVGMPFGKRGAYWLLVDNEVKLKYTSYDFEYAARQITQTDHPNAESFAKIYVLNPPTEEVMLISLSKC